MAMIPWLEEERRGAIRVHDDERNLDDDGRAWVAEIDAVLVPARAALAAARQGSR